MITDERIREVYFYFISKEILETLGKKHLENFYDVIGNKDQIMSLYERLDSKWKEMNTLNKIAGIKEKAMKEAVYVLYYELGYNQSKIERLIGTSRRTIYGWIKTSGIELMNYYNQPLLSQIEAEVLNRAYDNIQVIEKVKEVI